MEFSKNSGTSIWEGTRHALGNVNDTGLAGLDLSAVGQAAGGLLKRC